MQVRAGQDRSQRFATIQEIVGAARKRLPGEVWDYLTGGAEAELTLKRNRHALDALAFRPRVLRDVSTLDTTSSVAGLKLRLPVFLAPIGSLVLFDPGAALASAAAAAAFGVTSFISLMTLPGLDIVARDAGGPLIFQLYLRGDRAWQKDVLDRVVAHGYRGLCLTVDTARYGRRERDLISRFAPRSAADRPNVTDVAGPVGDRIQAAMNWDTVADLVSLAPGLPLILKGIQTAEDAALALEVGAKAVYVSNHGGRQLDHARGTLEILPEVVAAVEGRAEVLVDGGFLRGSDVVKAVALGARAVGLGKLHGLALAAGGQEAVRRMLELLEDEIRSVLALLGASSLAELHPGLLVPTQPLTAPSLLSPFPTLLEAGPED